MFWKVPVALAALLAFWSPALSAGAWPSQPYNPPRIAPLPMWPGDVQAARSDNHGFCIQPGYIYPRPSVRRGGLVATHGALFFPTPEDLDLDNGPLHAISQKVRVLPRSHPVEALEDIPFNSAGGRVRDELFGDGFARWERDGSDLFPDWRELFNSNQPCPNGHYFVHHPATPLKRQFTRPEWPTIRDRHEDERLAEKAKLFFPSFDPQAAAGRLRVDHDF